MFDGKSPEEVLGKRPHETNKQAFRRRVKSLHPDAGDSHDAKLFDQVTKAYRLLEDPDAYARWQRTGKTEPAQAPDVQALIMQLFIGLLQRYRAETKYRDLIEDLKAEIRNQISAAEDELNAHKKNCDESRAIAERFEPKDSFMALFLLQQSQVAAQAEETTRLKIEALEKCLPELDKHKFNKEEKNQVQTGYVIRTFSNGSTTFGGW